jgi:hypothetical protein
MAKKANETNQDDSINKETSPKDDSKSVSLGLSPESKHAKRSQLQSKIGNRNSQIYYTSSLAKCQFFQKKPKKARLLQISELNTLNFMYNKDLQDILPQNTSDERRKKREEKMQNEPNLPNTKRRKYAKRTQSRIYPLFTPRVTGH